MRLLLLVLLGAALLPGEPRRVVLVEELVRVEAMERKTVVLFPLAQQDAQLEVKFSAKHEGEGVRVAVYPGDSNVAVGGTPYHTDETFRLELKRDHQYRVEIENMRQRLGHALVDMEVTLVFGLRPDPLPAASAVTLDPWRKRVTIGLSLTVFALILGYSAIRLTPPILERLRGER